MFFFLFFFFQVSIYYLFLQFEKWILFNIRLYNLKVHAKAAISQWVHLGISLIAICLESYPKYKSYKEKLLI